LWSNTTPNPYQVLRWAYCAGQCSHPTVEMLFTKMHLQFHLNQTEINFTWFIKKNKQCIIEALFISWNASQESHRGYNTTRLVICIHELQITNLLFSNKRRICFFVIISFFAFKDKIMSLNKSFFQFSINFRYQ
jgi:hypothetical protein